MLLFAAGVPTKGIIISTNRPDRGADGGGGVLHPGRLHPRLQLGGGALLLPPARAARCHARQGARSRRPRLRQ